MGLETADDAAIYKINDHLALIYTLDFFTPIVDDPYLFGYIAAANSLSDVYAMGGEPKICLNIVCFPNCMEKEILIEILRGAADKVKEAGCVLAGGHTVRDDEPKFGLSVIGTVHPEKYWANNHIQEDDVLFLTKPLGVGIINTALKGELARKEDVDMAIHSMQMLNKIGYDLAKDLEIHACTDITGFGLAGHVYEMAHHTDLTIEIDHQKIPYIKGVDQYLKLGLIPAGTYDNIQYVADNIRYVNPIKENTEAILFDPQTSGGLLFSLPRRDALILQERFKQVDIQTGVIGKVNKYHGVCVEVI